jgi:hypothetical protein
MPSNQNRVRDQPAFQQAVNNFEQQYRASYQAGQLARQASQQAQSNLSRRQDVSVSMSREVYDAVVNAVHHQLSYLSNHHAVAPLLAHALELLTRIPNGDSPVTLTALAATLPPPPLLAEPEPETAMRWTANESWWNNTYPPPQRFLGRRAASQYPDLRDTEPEDL